MAARAAGLSGARPRFVCRMTPVALMTRRGPGVRSAANRAFTSAARVRLLAAEPLCAASARAAGRASAGARATRAARGRCLDALAAQTCADREGVVVDSGSTDGSADMVRSEYPAVRLIRSATSLGFAAGNNLAIRATDTPYVATLNNDALAEPGW